MDWDVRPCADVAEVRKALVIWSYFGAEATDEDAARFAALCPPARMHGAWHGDLAIGGAGAFPFQIGLPGGRSAPSAGVTAVGVSTTHRRRGVLTSLMRAQLDDVHARGESIAWLWASEATIYGRFGYGLASFAVDVKLGRDRTAFVHDWPPAGAARLVGHDEALQIFPALYDRIAAQSIGMPSRTLAAWESRRLSDAPHRRQGAGVLNRLLLERDGQPIGYALYRVRIEPPPSSARVLVVVEAMGISPEADRTLWRHLLDFDWVTTIEASILPIDHPLFLWLAEPRRAQACITDALWLRLVDVGAALSARGYPSPEPLVFEIDDPFCPWNTGRWQLADGVAARTTAEPDLRMEVDVLGAAYLGALSFRRLAEAGRVEVRAPDAVARADRVFAAERAPWCPEIF